MNIFIWLGLLAGFLLWLILTFNKLVQAQNLIKEAWGGIDAQLKRRADLIPNLVEVVKGYAAHEKNIFENIAETRAQSLSSSNPAEKGLSENHLTRNLKSLLAVAEGYPQLMANQNFLDLSKNLVQIEDQIQMARRYYNGTVRNNNILIDSFPSLLVARTAGFQKADFFKIELATQKEPVQVDF